MFFHLSTNVTCLLILDQESLTAQFYPQMFLWNQDKIFIINILRTMQFEYKSPKRKQNQKNSNRCLNMTSVAKLSQGVYVEGSSPNYVHVHQKCLFTHLLIELRICQRGYFSKMWSSCLKLINWLIKGVKQSTSGISFRNTEPCSDCFFRIQTPCCSLCTCLFCFGHSYAQPACGYEKVTLSERSKNVFDTCVGVK